MGEDYARSRCGSPPVVHGWSSNEDIHLDPEDGASLGVAAAAMERALLNPAFILFLALALGVGLGAAAHPEN